MILLQSKFGLSTPYLDADGQLADGRGNAGIKVYVMQKVTLTRKTLGQGRYVEIFPCVQIRITGHNQHKR
ncbi:MAG: hypothetical protein D6814_14230, partial [Calditrichaeota bacterium]